MKNLKICASFILLIVACTPSNKNRAKRIEFATGYCFSICPHLALSIDSTLQCKLYIDSIGKRKCYAGSVKKKFWNELLGRLNDIDYRNDDTSKIFANDIQFAELIIYDAKGRKRLLRQPFGATDKVSKLMTWLNDKRQILELKPTPDTLHFGTTLQLPPGWHQ